MNFPLRIILVAALGLAPYAALTAYTDPIPSSTPKWAGASPVPSQPATSPIRQVRPSFVWSPPEKPIRFEASQSQTATRCSDLPSSSLPSCSAAPVLQPARPGASAHERQGKGSLPNCRRVRHPSPRNPGERNFGPPGPGSCW